MNKAEIAFLTYAKKNNITGAAYIWQRDSFIDGYKEGSAASARTVQPRNFCTDCGKRTPPDSVYTCTPPAPEQPAQESADDTRITMDGYPTAHIGAALEALEDNDVSGATAILKAALSHKPAQEGMTDERALFESWAKQQKAIGQEVHKTEDGYYSNPNFSIAWAAWKARALLASQPAAPVEICDNCDTAAPGCSGEFAKDGASCKFHGAAPVEAAKSRKSYQLGNFTTELLLVVALVSSAIFMRLQVIENRALTAKIDGMLAMQAVQPVACAPAPVLSEKSCAAWLFDTDIQRAKQRICGLN